MEDEEFLLQIWKIRRFAPIWKIRSFACSKIWKIRSFALDRELLL